MLKVEQNLRPEFKRLNSWNEWYAYRESMIFRSESQFAYFQERALDDICNYYGKRNFTPPTSTICDPQSTTDCILLQTSGSTGKSRSYHYPMLQYQIIEAHHFWRIEREYGIDQPGLVLAFLYAPRYKSDEEYQESFLSKSDPIPDLGFKNSPLFFNFRRNTGSASFTKTLLEGRDAKPKLVYGSPSQIEFMYSRTGGSIQFDCPFISTRETLHSHVRDMAKRMFPVVIDKMRCWDGGLSFYECKYGRKHIYDELSFVEESDHRLLLSTDFYNYATPFFRHQNGDVGDVGIGGCDCGVYGKYLSKFEGKTAELIHIGNYLIPGSFLVEDINSLLKYGQCVSYVFTQSMKQKYQSDNIFANVNLIYRVKQAADGKITFFYRSEGPLTETQINALRDALYFIFYRHVEENLKIFPKEREFYVAPAEITICSDLDLMCDTKGSRFKSLCIESELTQKPTSDII